ncbi:MAG: paraquat-inducible protein A [Planctomycetota bacterium]|jgi:paraquat-inducible protein A
MDRITGSAEATTDAARWESYVACHDCDLLQRRLPAPRGTRARCARCGARLYRPVQWSVDRTLAYTLASLVLMSVVLAFPFMEYHFGGRVQVSQLASGAMQLWNDGFPGLACLVLVTSVLAPAALLVTLLLVCAPLRLGRRSRFVAPLTRLLGSLQRWSMLEVYLLGVIVSLVKLSQEADLVLGPGCYALFALILTLTAAVGAFDARGVWARLDR